MWTIARIAHTFAQLTIPVSIHTETRTGFWAMTGTRGSTACRTGSWPTFTANSVSVEAEACVAYAPTTDVVPSTIHTEIWARRGAKSGSARRVTWTR
jgi:hypothetical protein